MARFPDPFQLDLAEIFYYVQEEMLAQLATGQMFDHPSAAGSASERHWLNLFHRYLPQRYRANPAFVIDSTGRRSRQIDIAIYDNFNSPLLFPHQSGLHVPAESVHAVFEVKPTFSRQWIRDACEKAASVRALRSTRPRRPILAGILAATSAWTPKTFSPNLRAALQAIPQSDSRLDLGCCLEQGSFEQSLKKTRVSTPEESLIFFIIRLLERLKAQGRPPTPNLMQYARHLESFK
jgi:hypothetical protein